MIQLQNLMEIQPVDLKFNRLLLNILHLVNTHVLRPPQSESSSSSLSDAREALINAAVDALGVQQISSGPSPGLMSPMALRLLPFILWHY